jgi:polar amino acid transport system substrate-binding protein
MYGFFLLSLLIACLHRYKNCNRDLPPFNYGDNGVITGYTTEIVESLLVMTGIKGKKELMSWSTAYDIALKNSDVLIYSVVRNADRNQNSDGSAMLHPMKITFTG